MEQERRWPPAHSAAAGLGQRAELWIAGNLLSAAGDERRDASGAGKAEALGDAAERNEAFFECKPGDEPALDRAVTRGDRLRRGVERRRNGVDDIVELRAAGMDLRPGKFFTPVDLLDDGWNAVDPGGGAEVDLRDGAIEKVFLVIDLLGYE